MISRWFSVGCHTQQMAGGRNGPLTFGRLFLKMGAVFSGQNLFLRGW